jgi:hypothetical protein
MYSMSPGAPAASHHAVLEPPTRTQHRVTRRLMPFLMFVY